MQQIFEVLFGNVERYLDVLGRFKPGLSQLASEGFAEQVKAYNESSNILIDDFDYIKDKGGKKSVKSDLMF